MSAASNAEFRKSWRYRIGLSLIGIGHLAIGATLALPALGFGGAAMGAMFVAGEVMCWVSIIFLGKEGFLEIKRKIVAVLRHGFEGQVGKVRHYVGIVLVNTDILAKAAIGIMDWTYTRRATIENPMPEIWGLPWEEQGGLALKILIASEICFLVGIYFLGADWWGRFRGLFVWRPVGEKQADRAPKESPAAP